MLSLPKISGQFLKAFGQLNLSKELSKRWSVNMLSEGKTVVQFVNRKVPGVLYLLSYSQLGFRLSNDLFAVGPIALFPRFVMQWNVKDYKSINEDSLALFYLMVPKVDILVIGIEEPSVPPQLLGAQMFLNSKGINAEILPVQKALETYNYLCVEGRNVGGAFIPPVTFSITSGWNKKSKNVFGKDHTKIQPMEDNLELDYYNSIYNWEFVKFQQGYSTREEFCEKMKELQKNLVEHKTDH